MPDAHGFPNVIVQLTRSGRNWCTCARCCDLFVLEAERGQRVTRSAPSRRPFATTAAGTRALELPGRGSQAVPGYSGTGDGG